MFRKTTVSTAVLALALGLTACGGGNDAPAVAPTLTLGDAIALTVSGKLISFNRATPGTLTGSIGITGVTAGEKLLDIDIRTASLANSANNGQLYALGDKGTIYTVDLSTGVAKVASRLMADTTDTTAPFTALSGTSFSIDFNPTVDRLRVVSDTGQNLRINVDTGATTTDGAITPVAGQASATVNGVAYTNAFQGAVTTQLFDLNTATNSVDLQNPPNNGGLESPVALGVSPSAVAGYDIDSSNNKGYAVLTVGGVQALYAINPGATAVAPATPVAATAPLAIGGGEGVAGFALIQPKTLSVTGLTTDNKLVTFDPRTPNTLKTNAAISGLKTTSETVVGMDVRPQDGLLWALSSVGNLYTLDPSTGAATFKVAIMATLDATATYSVDFNPAANRLRVISSKGQNLRIAVADVPATATTALVPAGTTVVDGTINRADASASSVIAAAYTNSFAGTTATALFDIDSVANSLTLQNPPNAGNLVNVGNAFTGVTSANGTAFDIAGGSNGLALTAIRDGATGPFVLRTIGLSNATVPGALALYPTSAAVPGTVATSQIGGASGPALLDIAISIK